MSPVHVYSRLSHDMLVILRGSAPTQQAAFHIGYQYLKKEFTKSVIPKFGEIKVTNIVEICITESEIHDPNSQTLIYCATYGGNYRGNK